MPIVLSNNPGMGALAGLAYAKGQGDWNKWLAEYHFNQQQAQDDVINQFLNRESREDMQQSSLDASAIERSFDRALTSEGRDFTANEAEKQREYAAVQAKMNRDSAMGIAGMRADAYGARGRYPGDQYMGRMPEGSMMPTVLSGDSAEDAGSQTPSSTFGSWMGMMGADPAVQTTWNPSTGELMKVPAQATPAPFIQNPQFQDMRGR